MIYAIDPGTRESGWVLYDEVKRELVDHGKTANELLLARILEIAYDPYLCPALVCEHIEHYGKKMNAGQTTFDTCWWAGRFYEAWRSALAHCDKRPVLSMIPRRIVKQQICGNGAAKDKDIIEGVKSRFQPTGGGKDPYKGTKAKPGPLYGVKADAWQALALAITAAERG